MLAWQAAGKAEAAQAQLQADTRLAAFEAERLRMQAEQALVTSRQAQVPRRAAKGGPRGCGCCEPFGCGCCESFGCGGCESFGCSCGCWRSPLQRLTVSASAWGGTWQVDADARDEKLRVLKSEYYALQTASATKIATLEASQASLTERIKVRVQPSRPGTLT